MSTSVNKCQRVPTSVNKRQQVSKSESCVHKYVITIVTKYQQESTSVNECQQVLTSANGKVFDGKLISKS